MNVEKTDEKMERLKDQCEVEFGGDWRKFSADLQSRADLYQGYPGLTKHRGRILDDLPAVKTLANFQDQSKR